MNILVTGGCGYVGTILTNRLLADGHVVTVVDIMWFGNHLKDHPNLTVIQADIRETDRVPMEGIDVIVHLANIANDPSVDLNSKLTWEVNVLATKTLVEKAIACGVKQFIYASSGSVYGVKDEDKVTEELSLVPISDYNKTKMISERVLLSYQNEITIQCVRPATVCGYSPRMRFDISVNLLTLLALKNGKITVFGGSQTRPNIHIQDLIEVYCHFITLGSSVSGIFNAGFENLSILNVAQMVQENVPSEIVVTSSNDPRSYRLCSDKLLQTGFSPKYNVSYGIQEVITQYQSGVLKDSDIHYNMRVMKEVIPNSGLISHI